MRIDIVPDNVNGFVRMFVQESLQKLSNLWSALAATEDDNRFSSVVIDTPNTVMLLRLSRSRYHDLLSLWRLHCLECRLPTDVEFVHIIEDFTWF